LRVIRSRRDGARLPRETSPAEVAEKSQYDKNDDDDPEQAHVSPFVGGFATLMPRWPNSATWAGLRGERNDPGSRADGRARSAYEAGGPASSSTGERREAVVGPSDKFRGPTVSVGAGPNEGPGNGLGDGGHRLHEWFPTGADADRKAISGRLAGVNGQVVDEFMATGAVVAGRGTFEPAGGWAGDHHDAVPIFVLSRREPDSEMGQWPLVTYVNDVRTAMSEAKRAAGDKNVLVHGAGTAQLALAAGVLDELEIHLIPVLLGQGRRLFDNLRPEHIELKRTRILEGEAGVTHMHYRVQR
jgi:dihydrofolate reductase